MSDPFKNWPWVAKASVTLAAGGLVGFFVAGKVWGDVTTDVKHLKERVGEIEDDHDVLIQISTDVRWLRQEQTAMRAALDDLRKQPAPAPAGRQVNR